MTGEKAYVNASDRESYWPKSGEKLFSANIRNHRRHRAALYSSEPAILDAVLADERGWRDLSVPPMGMIVFRHEVLMEFLSESLEFIVQEKMGRRHDRACNEPR